MKKRSILLTAIMLLAITISVALPVSAAGAQVVASPQSVIYNGGSVDMEVYNIDGSNYFKLRDVAYLLKDSGSKFSVDFNTETMEMITAKGSDYAGVGGEMAAGADKSATCVASAWKLMVDGAAVEVSAYNLGGNNFFKLRDLGNAFGFKVAYDAAANAACIYSADYDSIPVMTVCGTVITEKAIAAATPVEGTYINNKGVTYPFTGVKIADLVSDLPADDVAVSLTSADGYVVESTGADLKAAYIIYLQKGEAILDTDPNGDTYTYRVVIGVGSPAKMVVSITAETEAVVTTPAESTLLTICGTAITDSAINAAAPAEGTYLNNKGIENTYVGAKVSDLVADLPADDAAVTVTATDGYVVSATGADLKAAVIVYTLNGEAVSDTDANGTVFTYRLLIGEGSPAKYVSTVVVG